MIRIAIVEDERICQEQLETYLKEYEKSTNDKYNIDIFNDGIEIVEDYHPCWDIIFMDIKMKHMDGMECARKIREYDQAVIIVFITTMAKFAIKGYEVDALDFILKPLSYPQFLNKMNKISSYIKKNNKHKYLLLPIEEQKAKVSINDILYIEVKNHELYFITNVKTYVIRDSMRNIERELQDYYFARCNQCYLVNLRNVQAVKKDTVIINDTELLMSRSRKKDFLHKLSDYLGNGYSI